MNYSIIQKSQLGGMHRLDAKYYQPIYLKLLNSILRHRAVCLESLSSKITQGPNPIFVEDGKSCLNGRSIKDYRVDINNSNSITEDEFRKYKNFLVRQGDILITLKGLGSIGKIGYAFGDHECIFSRDVGLIRVKEKSFSTFLYAFLASKYGVSQIERAISGGTGQLTLTTSAIKNIVVPVFSSSLIGIISKTILECESSYKDSNQLYSQAEEILLKELELTNFDSGNDVSTVITLFKVIDDHRLDADYFQPKYERLVKKLKEQNCKIFSQVISNVPAKFEPVLQPEETFNYVELSNIDSSIGTIDGNSEVLGKEAPSRAKRLLKENDVIISSVEGSLGKVALVDKEHENYLASTGFFQLRSKEILPEVLLVMARSIIFQMQLEQRCAGTILTAVPKESINDIIVPILPKETQQKIADLVRKSHEARKKSKQLLEEAKRRVEELIEKGK